MILKAGLLSATKLNYHTFFKCEVVWNSLLPLFQNKIEYKYKNNLVLRYKVRIINLIKSLPQFHSYRSVYFTEKNLECFMKGQSFKLCTDFAVILLL